MTGSYEQLLDCDSEKYVDIVKTQFSDVPIQNIHAEPEIRNAVPCIAYAHWKIKNNNLSANIVVTLSDALV